MRAVRAVRLPLLVLIALFTAVACGGTTETTESTQSGAGGQHNEADVAFAQGMIPHHRQAIEMSELANSNAGSSEVKALAEQIMAAQDPEIETMTGWLEDWGGSVEDGGMDMGSGMSGMSGMMSQTEMADLESATGAAFDRMFLEMMTRHHQGAVEMAQRELEQGEFGPAQELAQMIIDSQKAEIEEMQGLLEQL